MVLTNFECWAHGDIASNVDFELGRHVDPFNPRAVLGSGGAAAPLAAAVAATSHISSNGYYGFSFVNAAHEENSSNNNNNNNNNNSSRHNNMSTVINHVNGMSSSGDCSDGSQMGADAAAIVRCKKRFFVNDEGFAGGINEAAVDGGVGVAAAKRCRFDDDFAAQYCRDFFLLPSTQIGTQSCLMDTEEEEVQPQQQEQHQHQVVAPTVPTSVAYSTTFTTTQCSPNAPSNHSHEQLQTQQQPQNYQDDSHKSVYSGVECAFINAATKLVTAYNSLKNKKNNGADDVALDAEAAATLFAATHGGSVHHFNAAAANANFFEDI